MRKLKSLLTPVGGCGILISGRCRVDIAPVLHWRNALRGGFFFYVYQSSFFSCIFNISGDKGRFLVFRRQGILKQAVLIFDTVCAIFALHSPGFLL